MTCCSVQPGRLILVKGYEFWSFSKNMGKKIGKNISKNLSGKYSEKHIDHAKQKRRRVENLTTEQFRNS